MNDRADTIITLTFWGSAYVLAYAAIPALLLFWSGGNPAPAAVVGFFSGIWIIWAAVRLTNQPPKTPPDPP
jgi:hypothetical protein